MTTDVDTHLSHYGIKGMRWGQRKSQDSGESKTKRVAKVSAGVAVAAGAGYALYLINKSGSTKMSSISSNPNKVMVGSDVAKRIAHQRTSMASITSKLAETNRLADEQLRGWYNKFDVPIPERIYSR